MWLQSRSEARFSPLAQDLVAFARRGRVPWGLTAASKNVVQHPPDMATSPGISPLPEAKMPLRALLYRRPTEPQSLQVVFGTDMYQVRISRHRRARRYTLRIHAATREVVLTMPPRGSLREAQAFAEKHGDWIAARLTHLPEAVPFKHGTILPMRDIPHRVVHRPGERGTVWTETDRRGDRLICVAGEGPHVARRVTDYLKREVRRDLELASRRYAEKLGVTVKRVAVRDQSSRWGSCSSTGMLSFSWRLIFAPPFVLDYLAAHEVAHLVEMNHSPRFWRVVDSLCPHVRRAKAWLDAKGTELHRYGVTKQAPSRQTLRQRRDSDLFHL
jgi:predicted metal-dependent hydrolase